LVEIFTAEYAEFAESYQVYCLLEDYPLVLDQSMEEKTKYNQITQAIIGSAIEVHQALGPGLLESAYEACLAYELHNHGCKVEVQKPVPLIYKDVILDCGYRLDLMVEDCVIVEIKSVDHVLPIHQAQMLSYLKLTGCKVGLLINFNVRLLKQGIQRIEMNFLNDTQINVF
jgi:GxxExxY protein